MTSPAARPGRQAVGVVGTGRVGSVLGAALARAGHTVVAASGVSASSQRRAEALLPGVPLLPADEVVRRASLVLLAVPDEALPGLVSGLAATDAFRAGQLVAHPSARYGIAVLEPAAGVLPVALNPALTFTGTPVDLERLTGVTFGVTAPEPLRPVAEALALEMGGEPVWVPEEQRPLYAAAISSAADHLIALVVDATTLLQSAGVDQPARLLGPLLGAALDAGLRSGNAALTGPVARGDADAVAAHLAALRIAAPESVPPYVALARLAADHALAAGRLDPAAAAALLEVLAA